MIKVSDSVRGSLNSVSKHSLGLDPSPPLSSSGICVRRREISVGFILVEWGQCCWEKSMK